MLSLFHLHCVSINDTEVAHYNFNTHRPILVIFGRDVGEKVCYQWWFVIPTNVSETWTWTPKIVFSVMLYTLSRKRHCFACYIFDTHQPIL